MPGIVNNDVQANTATIGTTTCDSSGRWLYPGQPACLGYNSSTISNITGDGTVYTVVTNNSVFNIGSIYNGTTLTAPLTGKYHLFASLYGTSVTGFTLGTLSFVTSNGTYQCYLDSVNISRDVSGNRNTTICMMVDMDAADTATFTFMCSGGTKIVDISNATRNTCFAARLMQ